ncbi:MAG: enoyl-ACP reductase FabI [Brevibacterium aurantiacum]|uniref:Enoyl-[acyl-carrier-protein] reductase [NADH] n=2 Tax=Brevibacterium TaxID=1696 RepID=A0A1D7W4C8_BREAU|nr:MULTISPECIES: enoyl-ACP reductase FabI [Brevibacterium]MDN5549981.1 enoyl-ACP reductase FabI [Brevibacterium sp.]AOP53832.1 Enoyl-[acyl-carrier-protein] reductase [NADH] [Brevibacterium aurantiacum]AZL05945.1 enoyl-[acyl-carrier-protein] reductase FabI [Brevibacterium aurantiacum]AZL09507.1 enoyl-[acyl-carrier-protein] reductase FabI [Brevibacterium aurantiacum]AZL13142.1 enoyl-[acyl-carrier-protein] reductase FabI [Brevibacterium aurantiacum]
MGILDGKRILVTGVLTEASIAFAAARIAQEQGAEVILSSFGRQMKITQVIAERLPETPKVIELDATNEDDLAALPERLEGNIDGIVHAIAFAPKDALGGVFLDTPWDSVSAAIHVSAFSLKAITVAAKPVLNKGAGVVGLTFDATISWPVYDWMGVAKAAFESTARYLAKYVGEDGVRVNLVSAGPLKTTAATSIPGFGTLEDMWGDRAPLGWDQKDTTPAGKAIVALLSDWFPATTGEMIHVDGGFHSTGA